MHGGVAGGKRGSCEKIRPVGAPGLQQRRNPLLITGGGVPSRRVLHKFRIFSQLPAVPHAAEALRTVVTSVAR